MSDIWHLKMIATGRQAEIHLSSDPLPVRYRALAYSRRNNFPIDDSPGLAHGAADAHGDAQVKMLPSPNGGGATRPYPSIVALMIGLSAVAFLGIGTAYPHDPKRPELNGWFKSLKNKAGEPCCDAGDGQHAEAEWDMARVGYKVLLKHPHRPNEPGQWFDVPYSAVINQPNLSGIAMVWWWPSYGIDGRMTPMWRCFIPGPGG